MINSKAIDNFIIPFMKKHKIPGASVVIEDGETMYCMYGFSDVERKKSIHPRTLFEIGSMSKAFTALAIFLLEEQGKISLSDSVKKYIPWFKPYFIERGDGEQKCIKPVITIRNLLYHTSGIPFETLYMITPSIDDTSLENTVKSIKDVKLKNKPGTNYHYASNNYNVLALIIEKVTNQKFEDFMKVELLHPLGLWHTYIYYSEAMTTGNMAQGYKNAFFVPRPYDTPIYRGNTAGGYIISCAEDMSRWMKINMGLISIDEILKSAIKRSHEGEDELIDINPGYLNAAGWHLKKHGKIIQYIGENPTFSSKIIMNLESKWGICVLSNVNSNTTYHIADNVLKCEKMKSISHYKPDEYKRFAQIYTYIGAISSLIIGTLVYILVIRIYHGAKFTIPINFKLILPIILLIIAIVQFVFLPCAIKRKLNWKNLKIWGSPNIFFGSLLLMVAIVLFCLLFFII